MNEKDDLQFIQDSFALARQEYINRQKEKEINQKMDELYKENLRIPIPAWPSEEWFLENGWKLENYTFDNNASREVLKKENLIITEQITLYKERYIIKYIFSILNIHYKDLKDQLVFKGDIQTEEEFKTIEKILLRG